MREFSRLEQVYKQATIIPFDKESKFVFLETNIGVMTAFRMSSEGISIYLTMLLNIILIMDSPTLK